MPTISHILDLIANKWKRNGDNHRNIGMVVDRLQKAGGAVSA